MFTGVIADALDVPFGTALEVAAQGRGSAMPNRRYRFMFMQRLAMLLRVRVEPMLQKVLKGGFHAIQYSGEWRPDASFSEERCWVRRRSVRRLWIRVSHWIRVAAKRRAGLARS